MNALPGSFRHRPAPFLFFSLLLMLSLPACGSNSNLYNGSGGGGTAAAALQIANIDISQGNYSGAIAVLSPYCPANNCVSSDIANVYANAYLASGNAGTGTSVNGVTTATAASQGGATTSQILSTILTLIGNGSPTNSQIMQALATAVPCLASNTCGTQYLDNLGTALAALSGTPCTGPTTDSNSCPDSSTTLIVSAVYLLVVAQYETGLTYNGGVWELCPVNGGGTAGCTPSLSESTLLSDFSAAGARLSNIANILGAPCSAGCTNTTFTFTPQTLPNVVLYFAAALPSGSQTVATAVNQFFQSIYHCSQTPGTSCAQSQSTTAAFSATGLSYYLSQL